MAGHAAPSTQLRQAERPPSKPLSARAAFMAAASVRSQAMCFTEEAKRS